jgi:hypothetical protein
MERTMSRFAWLLLAGLVLPAFGAKTVTVDQMDQWLIRAQHKSDTKRANEIIDLQLSDRASETQLAQWEAKFSGPQTRDALLALVDASQFLALPKDQVLTDSPPDPKTQSAILSTAGKYVTETVRKLPNFFATRETLHFEDMPAQTSNQVTITTPGSYVTSRQPDSVGRIDTSSAESAFSEPLHLAGRSSIVVTYRDGEEVQVINPSEKAKPQMEQGYTTSGEFGPILSVVLGDAAHGKLEWAYWERQSPNPEAVFRYSVPLAQSHYTVQFPNFRPPISLHTAYHGEISIDPTTGVILRLTVIADPAPPYERFQADTMVSYAPVEIGGKAYICPVKGVAISKVPMAVKSPVPNNNGPLQTQINNTTFINYHVFRADTTILP